MIGAAIFVLNAFIRIIILNFDHNFEFMIERRQPKNKKGLRNRTQNIDPQNTKATKTMLSYSRYEGSDDK